MRSPSRSRSRSRARIPRKRDRAARAARLVFGKERSPGLLVVRFRPGAMHRETHRCLRPPPEAVTCHKPEMETGDNDYVRKLIPVAALLIPAALLLSQTT